MPVFNSRARCACAAAVLAVVSVNQTAKADQIFWTGNGETGNWDDPANWAEIGQGALPGSTQDAINNTGEQINYQSVDSYSVNSFTTNGLFVMAGGTFSGSQPGISTLEVDNGMEMFGGTLRGFVINSSGPGVSINNSTSNFFDNVTSNTSLDLSLSGALQVNNGLTLGSSAVVGVGGSGFLSFDNTESLSGGAVAFGLGTNYLSVEGNSTLTINGTFIHGGNGVIGYQRYVGGSNAIINNGTISADVSGDTITLIGSSFANTGTLSAANGGELLLNTSIDNTGGNIDVGSGSTVLVNGVSVTGGTIHGPGSLTFINSDLNILTDVTSNANFDLTNGTRVIIDSGLLLNPGNSINLDNSGFLIFDNTQSFNTGTVNFGPDSTQYLTIEGTSVLTIGTGATVQGATGVIGYQHLVGGANTLSNNGLISANTAGDTITLEPSILNNAGTIQAINGGKVTFNIASGTNSGTIAVDAASSAQISTNGTGLDNTGGDISIAGTFTLNTATISNGTVSGTGSLTAIDSASNILTNVSETAPIDLTNGGRILLNSSTLAANANLDNAGVLYVEGTSTFLSGTTTFGGDSTQYISVEGDSTLTINGMATIHGTRGVLGYQFLASGSNTINNHGTISADVSGGTITVQPTSFSNDGTVQAINGGEINFIAPNSTNTGTFSASGTGSVLSLNTTMDNTGGTISSSSSGTILLNNASISQGDISGTGSLTAIDSASNILTNVSESAPISLTTGGRILLNSSTLTANANLDNTGVLYIEGSSTFASGTTTLGSDSTQYISVEGTSTLTIDAPAIIHGTAGVLGYQFLLGGANNIINYGTISADVAGGTITIEPTNFTNVGTVQALNGGEINFTAANGINAGTLSASGTGSVFSLTTTLDNSGGNIASSSGATILLNSAAISNGNISGTGTLLAINSSSNILNNVNVATPINLTNGGRIVLNNSTLAANASLDNDAVLYVEGASTFSSGTITLKANSTQYISVEGGSYLTIDAPAIVHGTNGVLGYELLIPGPNTITNHGTISADVSGGTITIEPANFANDGTVQAIGGGEINVTATNTTNSGTFSASGAASVVSLTTNMDNTGGTITSSSNGVILLNTASITNGAITGSGSLTANSANTNFLNNVSESAPVNLTNGGRIILNGSTLSANANLDNDGILFIEGVSTFVSGTTTLGPDSTQSIAVEGGATLTVNAPAIIHGTNGIIGNTLLISGPSTIINHGTISADVAGGALTIEPTNFSNDGTIQALSGGTLVLDSNIANAGGIIHAGAGGTVEFNSITVTGGTLTGPGDLLFTNANANTLDNVTINGNLDLTGPGRVQLLDNLALTGNINVANGGFLFISNTQTLSTGNIDLQGNANIGIEGATTFTLGSAASVVASSTGNSIGNQYLVNGASSLINHGFISTLGSGATLSLSSTTPITNTGFITAGTGTTITDNAAITNTGGKIAANVGGTYIFNGVTVTGGTISGPGDLFLINSNSNVLDGVTVNGTLDMTGPGRTQLTDGLNLTGSVNMDNGAILFAISSQTITGGTINFGADGTQNLSIEGASILTLSSSTVIHGTNGTIGNQFSASGANGLINHGTIDANVSGGAFSILAPLTNTGTVHAAANASMAMSQGETQTAGSTTADGTITISAGGLALSGGTVSGNGTLSVTGPMTWSGGNVTGNGLLLANSGLSISNSVTRSGQGLIMVNNGFSMAPGASLDLTQSDLVINYTSTGISPIGTIATALAAGYNHGPWNGVGIKSSNGTLAAGTSLGYGDNTVLGYSTFDFQPVATDSVIVKYTWLGDTNLDGKVTNADLTMLNAGAAGHLSGWTNGDFNYDGTINADDYSLFMLGDAKQTGTLGPTVPEPAMIGIALVPLLMRRRARR